MAGFVQYILFFSDKSEKSDKVTKILLFENKLEMWAGKMIFEDFEERYLLIRFAQTDGGGNEMDLYREALRKAEAEVSGMLCNQILDPEDPCCGGVRSLDTWDVNFHDTAALYVRSVTLYLLRDSSFFENEKLYGRIELAYHYCLNWKHEDGTKDYIDCDFHTAAGSEVQNMAKCLHIMDRFGEGARKETIRAQMEQLMLDLAEGLVNGGFHTPNHRWIFSGALSAVNSLHPDQRYLDKIEQYLQEGIDIDEDGEYAERSAGIYSFVTNEGLILMARYLKRPEFYTYVRRNLCMLRYYREPDGSIFTMNSTRQDRGTTVWAEKYLSEYLYIGTYFKDQTLLDTADRLYTSAIDAGREIPITLEFLLLNPEFQHYQFSRNTKEQEPLEKYFQRAGIMRKVWKDCSVTLIPGSKTFFFARFGDIDLFLRMSAHFFKVRNVIPDHLEKIQGGYKLSFEAEGNYLLPFKEKQPTSDWWEMDHSKRELLKKTSLKIELDVLLSDSGAEFHIRTKTCDNVPLRVEIGISPNCLIHSDGFLLKAQAGMWLVARQGNIVAETVRSGIEIGEAFGEHGRVEGREGSAPRSSTHMTIYFNQFCTAQERVFHIQKTKQEGLS